MSGVWLFKDGVVRLIERPTREQLESGGATRVRKRRVLVHVPTEQVVRSYEELERHLHELGWVRYIAEHPTPDLIQFHRSPSSVHLISLPKRFSDLRSTHMYDIVVKNRSFFQVRDQPPQA